MLVDSNDVGEDENEKCKVLECWNSKKRLEILLTDCVFCLLRVWVGVA